MNLITHLEAVHYAEAERVVGTEGLITLQDSNTLYPDPTDATFYLISSTAVGTLKSEVDRAGTVTHTWHDGENEFTPEVRQ